MKGPPFRPLALRVLVVLAVLPIPATADPDRETVVSETTPLRLPWPDGAKAAVSFAYDDGDESHWRIAIPQLESFGFRGTFHLVTMRIMDWSPWIKAHDNGHELGNHTRSHRLLTDMPLWEARDEIRQAIHDIQTHVPGATVESFVYPRGSANDAIKRVVVNNHTSARTSGGINVGGSLDFFELKGLPPGPGCDITRVLDGIDYALRTGSYVIVYFHQINESVCSPEAHRAVLRYAASHGADLWVAPRREVVAHLSRTSGIPTTWGRIKSMYGSR